MSTTKGYGFDLMLGVWLVACGCLGFLLLLAWLASGLEVGGHDPRDNTSNTIGPALALAAGVAFAAGPIGVWIRHRQWPWLLAAALGFAVGASIAMLDALA